MPVSIRAVKMRVVTKNQKLKITMRESTMKEVVMKRKDAKAGALRKDTIQLLLRRTAIHLKWIMACLVVSTFRE